MPSKASSKLKNLSSSISRTGKTTAMLLRLQLLLLFASAVLCDFHILHGSCVDTEKPPKDCGGCPSHGPIITRWRESRLVPANQYNCKYLQNHGVELRDQDAVINKGLFQAENFCGKNLDMFNKDDGYSDVFIRGAPSRDGYCYPDRQELKCELKSPWVKTKCTYTRLKYCATPHVCT